MFENLIGVEKWLDFLRPMLSGADRYTWTGPEEGHWLPLLKRAAIKRQFEAIAATLEMVKAGHGYLAVTFVRPAYEELLWIEYLNQHKAIADELISLLARASLADSLGAQNEYIGSDQMRGLGFSEEFVERALAAKANVSKRLKEIGATLGWRKDAEIPSFSHIATKVGRFKECQFLYQGTSRFVHFSAHELLRRVWGRRGDVFIGSSSFSRYWEDFAIYWGFRIFVEVAISCADVMSDIDVDPEQNEAMTEILKDLRPVPIITMEELERW